MSQGRGGHAQRKEDSFSLWENFQDQGGPVSINHIGGSRPNLNVNGLQLIVHTLSHITQPVPNLSSFVAGGLDGQLSRASM